MQFYISERKMCKSTNHKSFVITSSLTFRCVDAIHFQVSTSELALKALQSKAGGLLTNIGVLL